MASSNIKLFDENKGNMLNDTEFNISTQRLNGLQTGVASSQLQNKAMYQTSLVAYAIAQIMMQNGKNANDTDAVSAFVANLSGTMLQKVYDLATTAEAQAGVATGKWMSPALVKAAIDTLAAKAQNILSSSTKALYGFGDDATPDDAFVRLNTLLENVKTSVDQKAQIVTGTYVGTGKYGQSNPCILTFGFKPQFVFVSTKIFVELSLHLVRGMTSAYVKPGQAISEAEITWTENGVSWYGTESAKLQLNNQGSNYCYAAIG